MLVTGSENLVRAALGTHSVTNPIEYRLIGLYLRGGNIKDTILFIRVPKTGEIAQSTKCLSHKHRNLSSDSPEPTQKLDVAIHVDTEKSMLDLPG